MGEQVREHLGLLQAACQEVQASNGLIHLLQAVLGVGNYLNQGTFKGNAPGPATHNLRRLNDGTAYTLTAMPCTIAAVHHGPDENSLAAAVVLDYSAAERVCSTCLLGLNVLFASSVTRKKPICALCRVAYLWYPFSMVHQMVSLCTGFKLETLLKLVDCRGSNDCKTLLHFILSQLLQDAPEIERLPQELLSVQTAAKLQVRGYSHA